MISSAASTSSPAKSCGRGWRTKGIAFCLSLPLDYPGGNALNPRRYPPRLRPTLRDGRPNFNCTLEGTGSTDVFSDGGSAVGAAPSLF